MTYFALSGLLAFVYVFLKAIQQLNVVHRNYKAIMPASVAMGICEVAIVLLVVKADTLMLGVINGVCSGLGAMLAMKLHRS